MEKVKITREQADAIESMRAKGLPNSEIVSRHVHGDHIRVNNLKSMDTMSLEALVIALYIGYEVEETPEDKVREYYNSFSDNQSGEFGKSFVKRTLDLLNIKIVGVNHE